MLGTLRTTVLERLPAASFLTFFLVLLLWACSVPMFGSPDESAHMVRAAGLVRGQVAGVVGDDGLVRFDVPSILVSEPPCYAFDPEKTADCLVLSDNPENADRATTASTYPPMLHLISGAPTLVSSGLKSLYLMRLAVSAVGAALFSEALINCSLLRRSRAIAAGLPLALTPMVFFLSGTVNPSGLTATAALAVWTAMFVLGEADPPRPIGRSAASLALPLCLLLLTRRDSLLWTAAIGLVFVVAIPFSHLAGLVRQRPVQAWGLVVASTAVVQGLFWTRGNASGFTAGANEATGGNGGAAFALWFNYFREVVGVLGWLDTNLPSIVHTVWWAAILGAVFASLVMARWRTNAALLLTLFLVVALTTFIGSIRHPYFQGRYYLPLAVGIPLLALKGVAEGLTDRLNTRVVVLGFGTLYGLNVIGFTQDLRRYAVGTSGTWKFVFDNQWEPTTGPIWLFLLAYPVALACLYFVIATVVLEPSTRPEPVASTPTNQEV